MAWWGLSQVAALVALFSISLAVAASAGDIPKSADLGVAVFPLNHPVTAGDFLTWVIRVGNDGPDDAEEVVLLDAVGSFVSLASPPGWACTTPEADHDGTVSCFAAHLPLGLSVFAITIRASVNAPPDFITTGATVMSPTPDPVSGNNSAMAVAQVLPAPIPTLDWRGLSAVAVLLAGAGALRVRRSRARR